MCHFHYVEDSYGDTVEAIPLCSDSCNRLYAKEAYRGWNGCHETEQTDFCQNCGVAIPGEDSCLCQKRNVVVNRFLSDTGEKCPCGNWLQVPADYLERN